MNINFLLLFGLLTLFSSCLITQAVEQKHAYKEPYMIRMTRMAFFTFSIPSLNQWLQHKFSQTSIKPIKGTLPWYR